MSSASPLEKERKQASFDVRSMTYLLEGGEEKCKRREKVRKYVEEDPVFRNDDRYTLDRYSLYKRGLEKSKHLVNRVQEIGLGNREDLEVFWDAVDMNLPTNLHYAMFVPTIMGQASVEQQSEWLPLALPFKIYGTYAQTELGHGTNVAGIETTATYDKSTKEFVINSPTVTSTKWWPGGLGKTSTHCVLMARLIIDDKDYGVHAFYVQLRSLEDHMPLPGITLGDIGPKMGYEAVDNGYLRFDHVRIPLFNMLAKYAQVSEDGVYSKPPHDKLSYGTMVFVRAHLIATASVTLSRAITIAIRYSAVRKQGYVIGAEKKGEEMTVLDFGLQQARLFPMLAESYALHFTGAFMKKFYVTVTSGIQQGNFDQLAEMHATAAGLKAYSTWKVSNGIEECRKSCGGHGYLLVSGLVHLFADYVPACTYEGDNYVLIQQTVKYLFKICESIQRQEKVTVESVSYLVEQEDPSLHTSSKQKVNWCDPNVQLKLLKLRAKRLVWEIFDEYSALVQSGLEPSQAWNRMQPLYPRAVNAHCVLYIASCFIDGVKSTNESSPSLVPVLARLSNFYILHQIEQSMVDFVEVGMISREQQLQIRQQKQTLMSEIRPDAVPLVDAFNHSDHLLNSALGRYDGRVYEALLESTKNEPLNHTPVPRGYEEFIRPMVHSKL
uniref:Acyl-coenzyme A oxidase n=1 Tax=Vannella robusta TaxID=1487602 RepID=A0A7S4IFR4_9EUKA|mmetsp:Transcript_25085/g.31914  ORF Transcript_25085/g.31914 Transcript_25085/m.31914 type:complete len:665 (+) Transcript_25085:1-1995(+)